MKRLLITLSLLCVLLPNLVLASRGDLQLISQDEMAGVLNDYLAEASQQLPRVELRFAAMHLPQPFKVPQGRLAFQVIPAKPEIIGSRRVTLLTRVDDQLVGNQSIRVELEALAEIVIAADNLRRGDLLGPDNVSLQYQDITTLKQPLFAAEDIYGKRLKRSVRLGQPLLEKQVEFPPLIKRGDRVKIQVQQGALLLTAAGEARQDGLRGESIKVMNSNSRREILCRVIAPGLVKVGY